MTEPAERVEKTTFAPGRSASSQRTPSFSLPPHRGLPRGLQGDRELLVAPGELAVELAAQRLGEAAADARPLRHAGGDQIVAVDLEGRPAATRVR